jgi:hypothetical protein
LGLHGSSDAVQHFGDEGDGHGSLSNVHRFQKPSARPYTGFANPSISENNIIVTDAEEGNPRGMLIDLDFAKELDSVPSGARHRTGTMEFMAIEVLEGRAHTYRHDLESFFYVFLWVIIRYG